MDCAETEAALVAYHFAEGSQLERDRVRTHLRHCSDCAQQYLDLKHDIDSGAHSDERPAPTRQAELRREVAALFPPQASRQAKPQRRWQLQPFRGARGPLLAAAMLAVIAVGGLLLLPRGPATATDCPAPLAAASAPAVEVVPIAFPLPQRTVDSARPQPLSISYY